MLGVERKKREKSGKIDMMNISDKKFPLKMARCSFAPLSKLSLFMVEKKSSKVESRDCTLPT
jgi:hypothetical protein